MDVRGESRTYLASTVQLIADLVHVDDALRGVTVPEDVGIRLHELPCLCLRNLIARRQDVRLLHKLLIGILVLDSLL